MFKNFLSYFLIRMLTLVCLLSMAGLQAADPLTDTDLESRIEQLESLNRELLDRLESLESQRPGVIPVGHAPSSHAIRKTSAENPSDKGSPSKHPNTAEKDPAEKEEEPFYEIGSDPNLKGTWKHGLELNSAHKDFRVHVGGRTQFDSSWFHAEPQVNEDPSLVYPIQDGVDFRRARLRVDGTMYETIDWAAEYDFVNSSQVLTSTSGTRTAIDSPAPTDLWFHFKEVPWVANIRVGNHKEPIGMEHIISSQHLPFMERSFNQDAFYGAFNNGFTPGISIFDNWAGERGTWTIGIFKPTTNAFAANNTPGDSSVTGRLTWLPQYQDDGAYLLHMGVSARYANLADGDVRFRTRGPERSGQSSARPSFADTGNIFGQNQQMINFELAKNIGSWTIQSEYLLNYVQDGAAVAGSPVGTLFYHGGYVEVLYFLTGEFRAYKLDTGIFDRVIPLQNAFFVRTPDGPCGSWGGWQVGFRYNYLDLNDLGVNGGILNDYTWSANWFLNPNLKVQWNYSLTDRQSPDSSIYDGWIQGFGMRLAHSF